MMFKCDKCGKCCKNLHLSPIYDNLHDGSGVCRYLKGNLCSVYETRPIICRVEEAYEVFFKDKTDFDTYMKLNYEACELLKKFKEE